MHQTSRGCTEADVQIETASLELQGEEVSLNPLAV